MKIGIYPTHIPNTGLGKQAWQTFFVDEDDVDGGEIIAYFHHDTPTEKIEAALLAMHPNAEFDWIV